MLAWMSKHGLRSELYVKEALKLMNYSVVDRLMKYKTSLCFPILNYQLPILLHVKKLH